MVSERTSSTCTVSMCSGSEGLVISEVTDGEVEACCKDGGEREDEVSVCWLAFEETGSPAIGVVWPVCNDDSGKG